MTNEQRPLFPDLDAATQRALVRSLKRVDQEERRQRIVAMRRARGLKFREMALELGVSTVRARQKFCEALVHRDALAARMLALQNGEDTQP